MSAPSRKRRILDLALQMDNNNCVDSTSHKNNNEELNIPVLSADVAEEGEPYLHVMARPSVFNAGERRAIFCQGKNLPDEINWYSPSGEVVPERTNLNARKYVERKVDDKGVLVPLIFHELKISDSGSWVCKAGEHNETIEIIVGIKVKIPKRTEEREGDEGKSIRLECKAEGHPLPVVQWYRDQRAINVEGSNKYALKKKGDTYALEIKNLSYEDIGDYVCKVTQKALSHYIDKTITLSVKHAPILRTFETVETYGILNEIKNLTCGAYAFPPPTYQWFRRNSNFDSEISDEDTVFTAEDGSWSVLSLRLRTEEDLGEYKCKVSNTKGSKTVIFDVSLGSKPPPPDNAALLSANATSLAFNVSCAACNFQPEEEGISARPDNLTVIGFQFQLTPVVEDYLPNWDVAFEELVDINEEHVFVVSSLPNMTSFHARVRSLNAAGYSDWFELAEHPSTTAHAVRLGATALLVLATILAIGY